MTTTNSFARQPTSLDYASPTQFKFQVTKLPKVEFFCLAIGVHRGPPPVRREQDEAPAIVCLARGLWAPDQGDLTGVARPEGLVAQVEEGVRVEDRGGEVRRERTLPRWSRAKERAEAKEG